MLTPDQFYVNEAWIVFQINEEFLYVQAEPYNIYMLLDAASTYVLGHVLSRAVDEAPEQKDVQDLLRKAWEAKGQWAKQLILPEESGVEDVFRQQAEKNGLSIKTVPESELEPIIGPLKESFASDFMRPPT
jgi:hypothetical protein